VLTNFYKDEELGTVKEILFKAISTAVQHVGRDIDLPRLPKRQGPNKSKQTVDDLITLYDIVDEQKLNDELPVFVAANLLRIPFLNADSMSVAKVVQKFDLFEQRLLALEQRSILPCTVHNVNPELSNMDCSMGMEQVSGLDQGQSDELENSHETDSWETVSRKKLRFSAVVKSGNHSSQAAG